MNSNVAPSGDPAKGDRRPPKTDLDVQGPRMEQTLNNVTTKGAVQPTKPLPGPISVFVTNQDYGHSPYADVLDTNSDPAPSTRVPSSPTISYVTATDDDDSDSDVDMTGTPPDSARRPDGGAAFPAHNPYGIPPSTFAFGLQGHSPATAPPVLVNPIPTYQYGASPYQPGASHAASSPKKGDRIASHAAQSPSDDLASDSNACVKSVPKTKEDELDLLHKIRGTYRLLDLYSENGSGGLVDKIIISQESLKSFVNQLVPGAYKSVTKIDFSALDVIPMKPIGIYGSKSEIVRFLHHADAISDDIAALLLAEQDPSRHTQPHLRSGIYALLASRSAEDSSPMVYVIYWPEENTWNDGASGSIKKNRVTFMRYLTRLADQIRALISGEHSKALVWNNVLGEASDDESDSSNSDDSTDSDDAVDERFFKFEVAKTKEEEESANVRPGFSFQHSVLSPNTTTSPPSTSSKNSTPVTVGPVLLAGETRQAFMTSKLLGERYEEQRFDGKFSPLYLKSELSKYGSIVLAQSVDRAGLDILLNDGDLKKRIPNIYEDYRNRLHGITTQRDKDQRDFDNQVNTEIRTNRPRLMSEISQYLQDLIAEAYPSLGSGSSNNAQKSNDDPTKEAFAYITNIRGLYPSVDEAFRKTLRENEQDLTKIKSRSFKKAKKHFLTVLTVSQPRDGFDSGRREESIRNSFADDHFKGLSASNKASDYVPARTGLWKSMLGIFGYGTDNAPYAEDHIPKQSDKEFLASLPTIASQDPVFTEAIFKINELARAGLQERLKEVSSQLVSRMELAQVKDSAARGKTEIQNRAAQDEMEAYSQFRDVVDTSFRAQAPTRPPLYITSVRKAYAYTQIDIKSYSQRRLEAQMERFIWTLDLTEDDKQKLREDARHVPTPRLPRQPAVSFSTPLDWNICHAQALGDSSYMLIVDTPTATQVWLFSSSSGFPQGRSPTKSIPRPADRDYLVTFDEQTRLLALTLIYRHKVEVQLFLMNETYTALNARGTPFNLTRWYPEGVPKLAKSCFFAGSEELCLVETSGRIRTFSFVSQGFRPGFVQLQGRPLFVQSSPDGAALLVVESTPDGGALLKVFHQASFGSKANGVTLQLPDDFASTSSLATTSISRRSNVFITAFSSSHALVSVAIDISKKETEYQFRAKHDLSRSSASVPTRHNSLIDCFQEVWGRYPVAAAIQRETLSSDHRLAKSITFVSEAQGKPFESYFKQMIRDFERLSKKPTERRLDKIDVDAQTFELVEWELPSASRFKSGEWLAELLCLIPIHIAVAKENRFIPLKDGVLDPALERELLGADMSRIIDSITLGWYESIFSSYMASKPVKVISSMGEQSVGKSYSLNHMVDSSFAGSAVRTTEGVWLSVCPTKNYLVVALDFEGVHSIERTAQEDMLLVLFNTALSNLVLFRNNFALSRDVANMFTSFQASTHLFDPASNPRLFKGLLAIVIKDVVDSDKKEIVKEFSSKFSQIVSNEQETNFITVLHDSQLTVIPWSVIQSREFYTLFSKLGKMLFKQRTTHGSAGEFLITLKTLMAKLKAQDWGSIDQTVIKHRTASLAATLATALSTGLGESSPVQESLKNMDNQEEIPADGDSATIFFIGKDAQHIQEALSNHLSTWNHDAARHPLEDFNEHIQALADARIAHVKTWLAQNLARFPADNSDIRALKRDFEQQAECLKTNVKLCLSECSSCRLRCVLHKTHNEAAHDCCTSHRCEDACEYSDGHDALANCGFQAGHSGKHICNASAHVCGAPCDLNQKKGCQHVCMKPSDHIDDEHICSARSHQCGEPCDLRDARTPAGGHFSCSNLCTLPHDEVHERHRCENPQMCPITCELCTRLCSVRDHFHGLEANEDHLCGQEHDCRHLCEAQGICEVIPTPHSVETVFSGRHGTFQYTKYTQEAKRLPCEVKIEPGKRGHDGPHLHSDDPNAFHFCETSCRNCGYICHLPLGHSQSEHETSHGSMEHTAWAIEGDADASVELQGRKFAAQDGGAPQLCSSICRDLGRHAHIVYCRNEKGPCQEPESEHITKPMLPNPHQAKDWVSHKVFWARTGFKDPYSNHEQSDFALCDVQCPGTEHHATASAPANPSFCTLPIFHPPHPVNFQAAGNTSYVSTDGHQFGCPNPHTLQQAYHVIFLIDISGSMSIDDRRPLPGQPVTRLISQHNDNRFGAVLSALYGFWTSRSSGTPGGRRDAYTVVNFDHGVRPTTIVNDFTSTPDELLNHLLRTNVDGGTHFDGALTAAEAAMERHWAAERHVVRNSSPVIVFLSDGECRVSDPIIDSLCRRAVALGKALSFHAVSFGPAGSSASLHRMVTVAEQIARNAPRDPLAPQIVPCGFTDAIDTIQLAQTFMNIAESLKKPRASLMRV